MKSERTLAYVGGGKRVEFEDDAVRSPGLEANHLEGYAYLFRIVLPLLNAIRDNLLSSPGMSILS